MKKIKTNKPKCNRGYSCGMSCINVKLMCRQDGLAGQFVNLADNYFQQAAAPAISKEALKDEDSIGSGVWGKTWLIGDKIIKRYNTSENIEEFKAGNALLNDTLAKEGVMPRHYGFELGKDGKYYSEQEALIGYVSGKALKDKKVLLDEPSLDASFQKIADAMLKHLVLHSDAHIDNIMFRLAEDGKTVLDMKLIDGDFGFLAKGNYTNPQKIVEGEIRTIRNDVLNWLLP